MAPPVFSFNPIFYILSYLVGYGTILGSIHSVTIFFFVEVFALYLLFGAWGTIH